MAEHGTSRWDEQFGQCRVVADTQRRSSSSVTGGHSPKVGGPAPSSPETGEAAASDEPQKAVNGYGDCYPGALTVLGERQLVELGKFIRQQYLQSPGGTLFSAAGPLQEELKVWSTRTKRTILSAQCLLQGLFPEAKDEDIQRAVTLNPDMSKEILIPNHARCDRLRQLFFDEKRKWEGTLLVSSMWQQIDAFEHRWGKGNRKKSIVEYCDGPNSLRGLELPLPEGVSEEMLKDLREVAHDMVDVCAGKYNAEVKRLSMGLLLADLQREIHGAAAGRSGPRCVVRSAHDVSLTGLLTALGLSTHGWPTFGSSIFVELLRDLPSGSFQVRVAMYDGVPGTSTKVLDVVVPLEAWDRVVPALCLREDEYLEQCRLPSGAPEPPRHFW